jgi:hypothetical protein
MRFVTEYIKLIQSFVSSGEILVGGIFLNQNITLDLANISKAGRSEDSSVLTLVACLHRIQDLDYAS